MTACRLLAECLILVDPPIAHRWPAVLAQFAAKDGSSSELARSAIPEFRFDQDRAPSFPARLDSW